MQMLYDREGTVKLCIWVSKWCRGQSNTVEYSAAYNQVHLSRSNRPRLSQCRCVITPYLNDWLHLCVKKKVGSNKLTYAPSWKTPSTTTHWWRRALERKAKSAATEDWMSQVVLRFFWPPALWQMGVANLGSGPCPPCLHIPHAQYFPFLWSSYIVFLPTNHSCFKGALGHNSYGFFLICTLQSLRSTCCFLWLDGVLLLFVFSLRFFLRWWLNYKKNLFIIYFYA